MPPRFHVHRFSGDAAVDHIPGFIQCGFPRIYERSVQIKEEKPVAFVADKFADHLVAVIQVPSGQCGDKGTESWLAEDMTRIALCGCPRHRVLELLRAGFQNDLLLFGIDHYQDSAGIWSLVLANLIDIKSVAADAQSRLPRMSKEFLAGDLIPRVGKVFVL
jgi:hypothetical protein